MTGKGEVVAGGGRQGPVLGADLGCCLQREGLEALYCPPVPHTSYPLSCVSPLIYPCPRVSWPLATAAAAPMDRPARDSAPDAHSLVHLPLSHLPGPHRPGRLLQQVPCTPVRALLRLNCGTSLMISRSRWQLSCPLCTPCLTKPCFPHTLSPEHTYPLVIVLVLRTQSSSTCYY